MITYYYVLLCRHSVPPGIMCTAAACLECVFRGVFAGRAVQFSFSTPIYISVIIIFFFVSFLFAYTVYNTERVNLILLQ